MCRYSSSKIVTRSETVFLEIATGKKKKKWPIKIKDEILDTNNEYARYAEKKNSVNLFKYLEYVCLHHPRIDV